MTIEFDTVTPEPAPTGRRRRAMAVLGASMLVAAAGGVGFGIGQAAGDDAAIVPAAEPDSEPRSEPDAGSGTAATAPLPDVPADEPSSTSMTAASVNDSDEVESADEMTASGGGGWTMFGGEPMALLTERTTDSGLTLRAHLGPIWTMDEMGYGDGPGGWEPPGWCVESGQVRIAVGGGAATGTSVIDVGSVGWWIEPFNGRAISALTMGTADANPYRVVFVQAPASVDLVTVTFDDGATDSTAPTNGVALLAVPGVGPTSDSGDGWFAPPRDFDITFDDATNGSSTIDGAQIGDDDPEFQASCVPPPPALPDAGEQPADPAAAEATIVDLMATVYGDADGGNDDRIDDPTGVAEARQQVRDTGFEDAASSAEAIVEELVFTSPTEAWFRYRIETGTNGTFRDRFGVAVDVDGVWKITRDTICQDLSLAGGDCGGDVEMIDPLAR